MISRYLIPLVFILLLSNARAENYLLSDKDKVFLDTIQKQTFRYFSEQVNPANGLVTDRADNSNKSSFDYAPASIAAVGFALSAYVVGAERGWIDKKAASELTLTTLGFFSEQMEHQHGFFYHFVDMQSGKRFWNCELSSIDTALFLAGALLAGGYYPDKRIGELAEKLYKRVDWQWMSNGGKYLSMGFRPESGFLDVSWKDYSESSIMYLMAIGSPTFPLPRSSWDRIERRRGGYANFEFIISPPLFTHQYSHIWIDFRDKHDRYADYFYNSIQATLANRRYCIDSAPSFSTFSEYSWGLTAAIGPTGYLAYGAPPGLTVNDGTVAPSAAGGSIVFTPKQSIAALRYFYAVHKEKLWGRYGFADSFNAKKAWFATDAYAINQGPILLMIENLRSGLIWKYFMRNRHIAKGLTLAGFRPGKGFGLNKKILPRVDYKVYHLHRRPQYKAVKISGQSQFPLDSIDFDSPVWKVKKVQSIRLDRQDLQIGLNGQTGYQAAFKLIHNDTHLFIRAIVRDRELSITHPDHEMYLDDAIEFYFDTAFDGLAWSGPDDYQLVASPKADFSAVRLAELFHKETDSKFRSYFRWVLQPKSIAILSEITKAIGIESKFDLPNKFKVTTPGGYEVILCIPKKDIHLTTSRLGFTISLHNSDRTPVSDAKFTWFFLEPGIHLGELVLEP